MAVPTPVKYVGWIAVGLFAMGSGTTAIALLYTSANAVTETGGAITVVAPDAVSGFDRGQQYAKDYLRDKGAEPPADGN